MLGAASVHSMVHQDISLSLDANPWSMNVINSIEFSDSSSPVQYFTLANSLQVTTEDGELEQIGNAQGGSLSQYRLTLPQNRRQVTLRYQGRLSQDVRSGLFGMPRTVADDKMLFLGGHSGWYPQFRDSPLTTFQLDISELKGWEVISQGLGEIHNGGVCFGMDVPQDAIYLIAARFTTYQRDVQIDDRRISLNMYLLSPDPALAGRYLKASADYLKDFSELIGPYPYDSFSIVENAWQTGYAMPSFTLLGSNVLRLPFILHTSLPHEILHNWWGNGVYVNPRSGNWAEGLTAYLADHRIRNEKGSGSIYRRSQLERYANFVSENSGFPLSQFRSRHSQASQAIGYGKSLMLFRMINQSLGDALFRQRLNGFWNEWRFDYASFDDLLAGLLDDEDAVADFAAQWLDRSGAPEILIDSVELVETGEGWQLVLQIAQHQIDHLYSLEVPIEIEYENSSTADRRVINLDRRSEAFSFGLSKRPKRISVDPEFDVFRRLDERERPPALGRFFGAQRLLVVLPSDATPSERQAWQQMVIQWRQRFDAVDTVEDTQFRPPADDSAVLVLGWNNQLLDAWLRTGEQSLIEYSDEDDQTVTLNDGQHFAVARYAVASMLADKGFGPALFIGADSPTSIAALARKLPHYGSYGQLAFELPAVTNVYKSRIPARNSPMVVELQ